MIGPWIHHGRSLRLCNNKKKNELGQEVLEMSQRRTDLFISSLKNHKITKQDSFSNMALPKESFLSLFSSSLTIFFFFFTFYFSGEIQTKKKKKKNCGKGRCRPLVRKRGGEPELWAIFSPRSRYSVSAG